MAEVCRAYALPRTPGTAIRCGLFDRAVREVWLEIGFGGGEHLIWQARHNPRCRPDRLRAVRGRRRQGADAPSTRAGSATSACMPTTRGRCCAGCPTASIARAFILFPDPWPKKRHHKRRLVSGRRLRDLWRASCGPARSCASPPTSATTRADLLALRGAGQLCLARARARATGASARPTGRRRATSKGPPRGPPLLLFSALPARPSM